MYLEVEMQQASTIYVVRGENATSKVRLVYLDVRLEKVRYVLR